MKHKKITIWTMKGGDGKTNIAVELALRMDYSVITNELYSILGKVLDEEQFLQLQKDQAIPDIKGDYGVIFDFGGYLDDRIIQAAKISDIVIVPTIPETTDLQGCINSILEIRKFNENILVLANKTENAEDFQFVKETIAQIGNYPVLEIKKSRALPNIYLEKKSIKQTAKEDSLKRHLYAKVLKQLDALEDFIKKC